MTGTQRFLTRLAAIHDRMAVEIAHGRAKDSRGPKAEMAQHQRRLAESARRAAEETR